MTIVSPFPAAYAGELHRWLNSPRDPNFTDEAGSDYTSVAAALAEKTKNGSTFAAFASDGRVIGFIGFAPCSLVWGFFAGMVMAPEFRRKGYGTWFLTMAVERLEARGFRKMSAVFFADNKAIMRTFKNSGAVEEGYLAGAATRGGELVDMRLWSFNMQGGR